MKEEDRSTAQVLKYEIERSLGAQLEQKLAWGRMGNQRDSVIIQVPGTGKIQVC